MFMLNRLNCLVVVAAVFLLAPAPGASQTLPVTYSAFAVTTGGPLTPGGAAVVDITITRWSTEEERARLITALQQKGHSGLLAALQDVESVGRLRTPTALGYELFYAEQEDLGDGRRRIILATDRPMSFYEIVNRPPSADYPFTFIELRVDEEGRGEGTLAVASAIAATPSGRITVINYDTQPIRLNEVRRVR